jgi:hypothetical protein
MKKTNLDKDWLYQKYIVENLSWVELAQLAGCSPYFINKMVKMYGFKKESNKVKEAREKTMLQNHGVVNAAHSKTAIEKKKQTNLQKYGTENQFQNSQVKEKIKQTNLSKYGVENPSQSQEVKDKKMATIIKNYGVDSPLKSEAILQKFSETVRERYGSDCTLKNPEIKAKAEATLLERYGVLNPFQSEEIRKKIQETQANNGQITLVCGKTPAFWSQEYNISDMAIYKWLQINKEFAEEDFKEFCQNYVHKISDIENLVSNSLGLTLWNKQPIAGFSYRPDFKITDTIYLNADGLYWHSEEKLPADYHFVMRKKYEDLNLRLFQFRADEIYFKMPIIKSMINNAIGNSQGKIGARKTTLKEVTTALAKSFLEQHHIKGYKPAKHIGLFLNEELISIMSYKIQESKIIKVERFCSKINTNVVGAFSKLLKGITNLVGNLSIHYWVDLRYGTGKFLLNHSFVLDKETQGWEWTDYKTTFNRLKCRANMDNRGLSEKEHAKELGLHKIWDAGQRLYVFKT